MTVIWPVYMDNEKTCKEGRKIPLTDSISNPNIDEITSAAKSLDLKPIKQADKSYPGEWYKHKGRVLVESETLTKREIILQLSRKIKIQREEIAKTLKDNKKKKKRYRNK